MMANRNLYFILILLLVVLILFGFIWYMEWGRQSGTKVIFKISKPVDPRDWMRGNYVDLHFDNNIAPSALSYANLSDAPDATEVYVILKQSGSYWVVESVQRDKPSDKLFVRAQITRKSGRTQLAYGIENYFVAKENASSLESALRRAGEASAEVYINPLGYAQLGRLLIDGKPWDET